MEKEQEGRYTGVVRSLLENLAADRYPVASEEHQATGTRKAEQAMRDRYVWAMM
ncbi:MAG: hypothetical protein JSR19_10900 [Proteobacteria bacterium]|nr:hypothetical protein [Pseudomonadota bacterium]HQR02551.1 hypothetical protein [Rhodocyclaceae bacterium]